MSNLRMRTQNDARSAIQSAAYNRRFNPVFDYFESLQKWDGTKRLPNMFCDFLGAPNNSIVKRESQIFLVATVRMALHSGSKFDQTVDLIGDQGAGKRLLSKILQTRTAQQTNQILHGLVRIGGFTLKTSSHLVIRIRK